VCLIIAESTLEMIEARTLPGRGKGIVCSEFIPKDATILEEEPFFRYHLGQYSTSLELATAFFEITADIDDDVFYKMAKLCGGSDLTALLYETQSDLTEGKADTDGREDSDKESDVSAMALSVLAVCQRNAFGGTGQSNTESESVDESAMRDMDPKGRPNPTQKCSFLYQAASYFNHSCDPNARHQVAVDGRIHVSARRDIEVGEEITIAYVRIDEPREIRREHLRSRYEFDCACIRCTSTLA